MKKKRRQTKFCQFVSMVVMITLTMLVGLTNVGSVKYVKAAQSDSFSMQFTTISTLSNRSTTFSLDTPMEVECQSGLLFEDCIRRGFAFRVTNFSLNQAAVNLMFGMNPTYKGSFTLYGKTNQTANLTLSFPKISEEVTPGWTMDEDPAYEFIERFHSTKSNVEIITIPLTKNDSGDPQKFKFVFRDGMQSAQGATFSSTFEERMEGYDVYHLVANDGSKDYEYTVYIVDGCEHQQATWRENDNQKGNYVYQCDVCRDVLRSLSKEEYEKEMAGQLTETTEATETTETTEEPVKPTTTETSEEPAKPTTTETTEEPVKPTTTETSEEPAKPTTTETSEEPVKPTTTETSEEPAKPTTTETSEEPVKPTTTETSEEPVKPTTTETTEELVKKDLSTVTIGQSFQSGNMIYRVIAKNEIAILRIKNKKTKQISIGSKVSYKGKNYSITRIEKKAFSGCSKCNKITISSKKIKWIGKNALKNMNAKLVIKVPKSKKKAYRQLFTSKTGFKNSMQLQGK